MIIIQCDNNNDKDVIYKNATCDELRMPPCDGDSLTNIRAFTNR